MFHRSHKGMKRWKFRTWVTRLSLASTFACWVKNSGNPFNTGLRELVLGAPRYGAWRTQGDTSHATTPPVASAVPSTLLINKTLPWIVDWILVQTFHACRKREKNDDYRTSQVFFKWSFSLYVHAQTTKSKNPHVSTYMFWRLAKYRILQFRVVTSYRFLCLLNKSARHTLG